MLSVGRLELNKRVELIVRALALTDRSVRLVIAGHGAARRRLDDIGGDARCRRPRSRSPAISTIGSSSISYAGALAVVYPPFDEDYGYVTLEAFLARKPVVTTTDAGGPLEFVEDGVNGLVAEPTAESIAAAIARLAADRSLARRLGEAGFERARQITWDGVVDRLVG